MKVLRLLVLTGIVGCLFAFMVVKQNQSYYFNEQGIYREVLENYPDALFNKSKGCTSPSGWACDEISWFSLQAEEYRNQWLKYAFEWLRETDPNGHLQMPVSRMISCPNETAGSYRAATNSKACPIGYSQEETIKKIWSKL